MMLCFKIINKKRTKSVKLRRYQPSYYRYFLDVDIFFGINVLTFLAIAYTQSINKI